MSNTLEGRTLNSAFGFKKQGYSGRLNLLQNRDCRIPIARHNVWKDFWLISLTVNNLTQTLVDQTNVVVSTPGFAGGFDS